MSQSGQNTVLPKNSGKKNLTNNKYLEYLTRAHILVPITILTSASAWIIYYGISRGFISVAMTIGLFFVGLITFSFIEYLVHRYLFHIIPNTKFKKNFQYAVHGIHHEFPKDKGRLAMPPLASAALSTGLFFAFRWIMGSAVYGFLPGFLVGYCTYLGVHFIVHAFQPPKNIFKVLWIHHGIHHYKDHERAFGVSSPLWDYIFRTMPK